MLLLFWVEVPNNTELILLQYLFTRQSTSHDMCTLLVLVSVTNGHPFTDHWCSRLFFVKHRIKGSKRHVVKRKGLFDNRLVGSTPGQRMPNSNDLCVRGTKSESSLTTLKILLLKILLGRTSPQDGFQNKRGVLFSCPTFKPSFKVLDI